MKNLKNALKIEQIKITELKTAEYNPRKWDKKQKNQLKKSIKEFGLVDPMVVNKHKNREKIVIGGHFRLEVLKEMKYESVPVVYVDLDEIRERELNIRLNKNQGEFDLDLLAEFDESLLSSLGFDSEELDDIYIDLDTEEKKTFDLEKALAKIGIENVKAKEGDIYQLGEHRLMVGSSCNKKNMKTLIGESKADMCMTDPPYRLKVYTRNNKAKQDGKKGYFGSMGNRAYIGTDNLPEDFTKQWMSAVKEISKPNFHIIVYEMWRNLREIWNVMEEQNWKVNNMLVWHTPNRTQGFSSKYRFFSKHDIAIVGGDGTKKINTEKEEDLIQNEYETALYAIQGKPHWEGYKKGGRFVPTDHIEHAVADEKTSGQSVVFGTKPIQILIPYIKVLTKRGDVVVEPFGGSGSTLIACEKLKRKCFIMEKQPIYAEVIIKRWENETGKKAIKLI